MIKEIIKKVVEGYNLEEKEAEEVMNYIMEGRAENSQIAALLVALRLKGETIPEITGFAKAMRSKAVRISPKVDILLDTCGTGGDKLNTFNISTAAAFVVAGCSCYIAKHGNRAVSSQCGSADVLEYLGVKLDLSKDKVEKCIEEIGIGFLFAPAFHPAMKYATPVRREIGIRTVFNILGPLTNPAGATCQLLGVYDPDLTEILAGVLNNLGSKRALVVHGLDGLDEVSTLGATKITELNEGKIKTYEITPQQFNLRVSKPEEIIAYPIKESAQLIIDILQGKRGPQRDIVLLNSAAALYACYKAKDFTEGIELAKKSIDSGYAFEKLEKLRNYE